MTDQGPFLLSDIQGDFEQQINTPETRDAFGSFSEQFTQSSENNSKYYLGNSDDSLNSLKQISGGSEPQHNDVDPLVPENRDDCDRPEMDITPNGEDAINEVKEGGNSVTNGHDVKTLGELHCDGSSSDLSSNNVIQIFDVQDINDEDKLSNVDFIKRETDIAETTDGSSLDNICKVKTSVPSDSDQNGETSRDEYKQYQQSKFNCVMCDSYFMDLRQLESHVKSHNEVLHFSILLKKVGKENEERTRNVISSLIELARSSDLSLNKFNSLFRSEYSSKRKYNAAKGRRKSKPRKKVIDPIVTDVSETDANLWNEPAADETVENEKTDSRYQTAGVKDSNACDGLTKRLRRRIKQDFRDNTESGNEDRDDDTEDDANVDTAEGNIGEENPNVAGDEEWNAITDGEFQLVKKTGPGRPAYGMKCPVCSKFITGRTKLKLHMKNEHDMFKSSGVHTAHKGNVKVHNCEVCGLKIKTLRKLKAHLLDKHNVTLSSNAKTYKCPLCDAFFGRRSELKDHRLEAHPGQSEHICTVCGKMLMSASLLEKHLRNHTGEKPFKCDLCPKAFAMNTKLQEHIRQHTGERPFVCEICGAKFNRSCNKKRHMLIHEGKFPHTCEICGKGFRDIGPLTLHIRRHNGDKPYKCEDANCNMAFITRGELECHRAKHTQKREHLCSLCGAEFLYKGDLRRHAKLHTGERPYKCSDCNAAFTRNQHLKHHWQSHHANGARVHKEWKPRKKPEQFGLPKQSSLLNAQSQSGIIPMPNTSPLQQHPSRFLQSHPQQQQQQPQNHQEQQQQQQQQHQPQHQNSTCVVCNQWFPSEAALKAHSIIHTMDSDHMFLNMATACRQDYNPLTGVQLNNLAAPLPGSVEVCTICNILITEPGTLQVHMQNVHGQYS